MQISRFLTILGLTLIILSCAQEKSGNNHYDITEYGAIGDSQTLNTTAIQAAINDAHENGGGIVNVPDGIFMSGSIFLKDNVTLHVSAGGTILGSPDINDYKEMTWGHNKDRQPYHLIVMQNIENASITGKGMIDGNGEAYWQEYEKDEDGNMVVPRWIMAKKKKVSPLIEVTESKNISINDVSIKTGGGWNLHLHNSKLVKVDGVNIVNNLYSPNSDAIDITGSTDVTVSNCYIKTCDDAICLKTTPDSRSCHRVSVTNCIIETLCVGLKLGCNESFKDITDVSFSNCVINKSSRAVGLYVREGATFENIAVSNIVSNTNAPLIFNRPIQIMVEKRDSASPLGAVKNVSISNFICNTEGRIILTAEKGSIVENVVLRDVTLCYPMIEDPSPFVEGSGSSQFPKPDKHPEAMGAKAAIVADNIHNLVVDNLILQWPQTDTTPAKWQHPERIENGSLRVHEEDYSQAKQTEFSVIWGKNLTGGYLNAPLANASSETLKKYDLINSNIKIKE